MIWLELAAAFVGGALATVAVLYLLVRRSLNRVGLGSLVPPLVGRRRTVAERIGAYAPAPLSLEEELLGPDEHVS